MISWINSWMQGIIIAVIIATIIEMILPDGNNKKYIKTVIGIYIIFSITYPLITKITGATLDFSGLVSKEKYIDTEYRNVGDRLVANANLQVQEVYEERIRNDIEIRLAERGYAVRKVEIEVETFDPARFGEINKIAVNVEENKEQKKEKTDKHASAVLEVESVDINVSNSSNINEKTNDISEESIEEIKSFLETIYGVDKEYIYINI